MRTLYRVLLRLYPESFRADYGHELSSTFEESTRGRSRAAAALEAVRDVVPNALLVHGGILRQDLRYALRTLNRARGFALTVVLVTAVGVGANTATFSVADFVLLRPLPFPEPDTLVRLCWGPRTGGETASVRFVTPQYFHTMGIPLLRGRDVEDGDVRERTAVAVVSESFAQHYWPDQDPIGRTFEARGEARTVVGVVGDVRVRGLEQASEPQLYLPAAQVPDAAFVNDDPQDLVVRHTGSTAALLPAVREIVRAADPEQPISDVGTLDDVVAGQTATRRAQLRILVALAAVALLLSAIGVYGLLAYTVTQRSREIGVRLALGAEPSGVARMIVWQGMKLALVGMVPGVLAAYWAARGMRALLFGVEPADPPTVLAVVAIVLLVTLAGSLVPVGRAVRVNPMLVLRAE